MAVKAMPGNTITETKTTTVVAADTARTLSDGLKLPSEGEFWDWISNMTPEMLAKYETEIRLHRIENGRKIEGCQELWYPPDQIRFSQRWVQGKFGGGSYRAWVKLEKQVRFTVDFVLAGLPKKAEEIDNDKNASGDGAARSYSPSSEMGYLVQALRESNQALLAEIRSSRGSDLQTDALRNSMSLGTQVLSTAVPAVAQIVASAAGGGNGGALQERLLGAMIEKLLNPAPPPDPFAIFERVSTTLKNIAGNEGNGGSETIAQTFVRVLPQVLDKIQGGMANMATLRQQELEIMRMRGGAPPNAITVRPQAPQANAQPNPLPDAPAAGASGDAGQPPLPQPPAGMDMRDFIELGIARIALNPQLTAEGAAMEMLVLLDAYIPELVDGTCQDPNAESELLKMFRERPILQQVPQNPRLSELIQKFLEKARESRNAVQPPEGANTGAAPAEPDPPQPSA